MIYLRKLGAKHFTDWTGNGGAGARPTTGAGEVGANGRYVKRMKTYNIGTFKLF